MFWLAEDHRVTAQAAASRNPEGGLDFYVRLRGLQSGAHAQLVSRYCSGAVNAGRGVSTARSNATFGRSVARKITPQTRKNSRMTQTNPEIAGAARFFSSLLDRTGTRPQATLHCLSSLKEASGPCTLPAAV